MTIFLVLLLKILPLYFLIVLGFLAGKFLKISKETIAKLLIYIITPIVVFNSVLVTQIIPGVLILPVMFLFLSVIISLSFYRISKFVWKDSTKNLLALASGTGNTGYFGLPVAVTLFGEKMAGLVLMAVLGFIVFENTLGFFMVARGHHTVKESIMRLLKLPTIYMFVLALVLNFLGLKMGQWFIDFSALFKGAYTVLGMMIIGLGLASVTGFKFDFKFLGLSFLAKFIVWPVLVLGIIFLDKYSLHFFTEVIYKVMILMAIVPLAANTVSYATELNVHPDKASFAVLLSTIVALFYVPLVSMLLF